MKIINVEDVSKEYHYVEKKQGVSGAFKNLFYPDKRVKIALEHVSLSAEDGEFIGLIGPNGAGKTTLMKILSGIINASEGNVSVMGYNPFEKKNEFKKNFALVMGQKSQLWWDLPAIDSFLLNKAIYQISDKEFKDNLDYFIEIFNVEKLLNQQVRLLSLGERMKMELIMSLLHSPKALFLDEPTIGLDAIAQKNIRNFLAKINKERGTNIILTSHYMEDIQRLCKRVIVINHGWVIYDGLLDELINKYSTKRIVCATLKEDLIPNIKGVELVESGEGRVKFKVLKDELKGVRQYLFDSYDVADINIEEEDIGDIIERIYNQN